MEIIVHGKIENLNTMREDYGTYTFKSRVEFNKFTKDCLDKMIEFPALRITFRILQVKG